MTTISGQHLQRRSLGKLWEVPHRADGAGYIGKCEKHIIKKKSVWKDVVVRESTRLTSGKCSRGGCTNAGREVDIIVSSGVKLCSKCYNEVRGKYTYEDESDHSEWLTENDEFESAEHNTD